MNTVSPPPTVIQLRDLLAEVSHRMLDDDLPHTERTMYELGLCRGLVENLIRTYPALTLGAGGFWVDPDGFE